MSRRARHYIQSRTSGKEKGRSPVSVEVDARTGDRREELAKQGFIAVSEKAAMIATYAKVPTKTGPGLTKVMLDGAKKDDGTIFVPAWLHAFFLQHGMKDSLIPRIQELKNDHRAQLVLAGAHLLSGRISSLERQAYEAFIDKTRGATTSK